MCHADSRRETRRDERNARSNISSVTVGNDGWRSSFVRADPPSPAEGCRARPNNHGISGREEPTRHDGERRVIASDVERSRFVPASVSPMVLRSVTASHVSPGAPPSYIPDRIRPGVPSSVVYSDGSVFASAVIREERLTHRVLSSASSPRRVS
ncbi:unnamed protein product [Lasius platythorax]|uniref:Uncharacterized protein n=1 Tax=Lasius platythorax TaxID=488582 RepID=A0AAV2NM66_9HYME